VTMIAGPTGGRASPRAAAAAVEATAPVEDP
jgi:hypothetical protein